MSAPIVVTVPATTANLGPGFDCLGAALKLYNQFSFTPLNAPAGFQSTKVTGEEAVRVTTDKSNLVYRAFAYFFEQQQQPIPAIEISISLNVPLARGLGSSSTAIVGGLLGANHLAKNPLQKAEILALATSLEGHPDNVVPALLGGCQLAVEDNGYLTLCPLTWHRSIAIVVGIPNFELSTESARSVLPQQYSRADAIFNVAHLGLLLRALEEGNGEWLSQAMNDRIHQPYRKTLIPGYDAVARATKAAGAYGLVISGAGPTLLALTDANSSDAVKHAFMNTWQQLKVEARVLSLTLDTEGAQVTVSH